MNTGYLLIMAVLAAVCLILARRKKNGDTCTFKELTMSLAERVILIYDIDKKALAEAYGHFSDISEQEVLAIEPEDNGFRLTFKPETEYISFCYWVNYLVYADESDRHRRFQAVGWYPFGQAKQNGVPLPFNNQTVMLYVEPDDSEYDNVSLVTPEGDHYLQPFAINGNLALHPAGTESYRPCPIHKT